MTGNDARTIGEFEELVLLAVRAAGNDTAVVEIQTLLREDAGRRASLGAIYSALERLERKGLSASQLGEPTARRGGKRKRYYRLTPAGASVLADSKATRDRLWFRGPGPGAEKA